MSGKARQCSGCGHIETKNVDGAFYCASCGSISYTLYFPAGESGQVATEDNYERDQPANKHVWVQYERDDGECTRCGALLMDPEGSAYCAKCEKYLGLN